MKKKPPRLVTIARFTVVTVALWISFEIYWTFTTQPEIGIGQEILAPVSPTLNIGVLDKIQSAVFFEEEEIRPLILIEEKASRVPKLTTTPEEGGSGEEEESEEIQLEPESTETGGEQS